jgi:hypothetical protein
MCMHVCLYIRTCLHSRVNVRIGVFMCEREGVSESGRVRESKLSLAGSSASHVLNAMARSCVP